MATMTPAQARVVDPVLTKLMLGYKVPNTVYDAIFPHVTVPVRGGNVVSWSKENLRLVDHTYVPGNQVLRVEFDYSSQTFSLIDKLEAAKTPWEIMDEASKGAGVDLVSQSIASVKSRIEVEKEKLAADLATTATNYSASNVTTYLAGAGWGGSANPLDDIHTAIGTIEDGTAGLTPNVLLLSSNAFRALKTNLAVIDQVKYMGMAPSSASVNEKTLAEMFGLERVVVGRHRHWDGTNTVATWGDDAVLAYSPPANPNMREPAFGYTYQLQGFPAVFRGYDDPQYHSRINDYQDVYQSVITMQDAGYLFKGAAL